MAFSNYKRGNQGACRIWRKILSELDSEGYRHIEKYRSKHTARVPTWRKSRSFQESHRLLSEMSACRSNIINQRETELL